MAWRPEKKGIASRQPQPGAFRAGFSGAPSPDARAAGKLVNFVFPLRRNSKRARGARGKLRMRTRLVFCAVALAMGGDAAAAELGLASFYGAQGLTAAHRSLPMGSRVRVLNLNNGRSVILRIADRGPFIRGRIIDVSTAAAVTLGFRDAGLAHVSIEAHVRGNPGGQRRAFAAGGACLRRDLVLCELQRRRLSRRASANRLGRRPSGAALGRCVGMREFPIAARPIRREHERSGCSIVATVAEVDLSGVERAVSIPGERPHGYGGGREHPRRGTVDAVVARCKHRAALGHQRLRASAHQIRRPPSISSTRPSKYSLRRMNSAASAMSAGSARRFHGNCRNDPLEHFRRHGGHHARVAIAGRDAGDADMLVRKFLPTKSPSWR